MVKPCWKPSVLEGDSNGHVDGLLWYIDHIGQFSMAVIQANQFLEDQCQIESGPLSDLDHGPHGTFVGVYDGHGGPEASRFVNHHLFSNVKKYASEHREISSTVIKKAYSATEEDFLSVVKKKWLSKPHFASVGSCCLAGIISDGMMYIANAGDSRVVLGRSKRGLKDVSAIQLSTEHNASYESVRDELRLKHPNDAQIVVQRHKVWRVKGIIQVSRSIGDAYLKKAEFNREPLLSKFILPRPFLNPILSWEPSISVHKLRPEDRFLVFASDGLWEHLSNQEVVDIVNYNPHNGIARRLVKAALVEAAKKREMRYSDLKKIEPGVRRHFHDDITVIVVFLDPYSINRRSSPPLSVKGGGGVAVDADL